MRYLPLYEAKMFHQFDHRWAEFRAVGLEVDRLVGAEEEDDDEPTNLQTDEPTDLDDDDGSGSTSLKTYRLTNLQKQDPGYLPTPRYWVSEADVLMRAVPLSREEKKELEAMDPERVVARLRPRAPKWLIAFRDIARSTDERTAIFSALPLVGCGHKAPLAILSQEIREELCFMALTDSFVWDWICRQKLGGTSFTLHYFKQIASLPPVGFESYSNRITECMLELVYTSAHLRPLAEEVHRSLGLEVGTSGELANLQTSNPTNLAEEVHRSLGLEVGEGRFVGLQVGKSVGQGGDADSSNREPSDPTNLQTYQPTNLDPFSFDEERRAVLRAELDALVARLYGLNRKQLRYILEPQGLSWAELENVNDGWEDPTCSGPHLLPAAPALDFPGETFRVLRDNESKKYGEYRTRRLVLEAWDRLWEELGPVEPLPLRFEGSEVGRSVDSDQPTNVQTSTPKDLEPGRPLDAPFSTGLFAEPVAAPPPRRPAPIASPASTTATFDDPDDRDQEDHHDQEDDDDEPFALVAPEPKPPKPLKDKQGTIIRVRVLGASGQEIVPSGTVVGQRKQGEKVEWAVLPDGSDAVRKFLSPPAAVKRLRE